MELSPLAGQDGQTLDMLLPEPRVRPGLLQNRALVHFADGGQDGLALNHYAMTR